MQTELVLDSLSTAVIVIDETLVPLYANASAEQLLGISRSRLTEHSLPHHYLSLALDEDLLGRTVSQQNSLSISRVPLITLENQAHVVDVSITPYETQQRRLCALIELRSVEQQLKIHQALVSKNQQQAAQLLVRGLAHEIKNPLGGLRGAAQLLDRELDQPEQQEFTTMIIEQADRLKAIVDKLLGPQHPSPRAPFNVHEPIEKALQLVEVTLPPGKIHIIRDYDPSIPEVVMEPDQMQQAILNIVQNAQQALEKSGDTITLRTRTKHQVSIGLHTHKMAVEIAIIDNGPGIDAALVDTLFYPMVTNKPEGSGLGLSIAHTIIAQHQGRIDCDTSHGCTEFTIWLPLTPAIQNEHQKDYHS
ncbi:nitrogen regulation protein NR(II) [Paraferrimonas haliotis]|nr:nitrogen regulation protein NR(II) [Paraferrimonas haliotis]